MLLSLLLLVVSFAMLLGGAFVFTNAVEWAGVRLKIGHGAVGSILAAVATAMPESLIPIVAIISGKQGGDIAVGAILGAPFLLGTLALAICGISAMAFRDHRAHRVREHASSGGSGSGGARTDARQDPGGGEVEKLRLDRTTMQHDLLVFLGAFAVVVLLGLISAKPVHIAGAVLLLAGYGVYTWRTIARGKQEGNEEQPAALFFDPSKQDPPTGTQIVLQTVLGIGLLVGGADLFVTQVEHIGEEIGVPALILALVLAPLASELPEKINSILWIRQGSDTLALGNITGAMVFQSMIPVSVGLIFTEWKLTGPALIASAAALAGAALALWPIRRGGRFGPPLIAIWLALYLVSVAAIILVK